MRQLGAMRNLSFPFQSSSLSSWLLKMIKSANEPPPTWKFLIEKHFLQKDYNQKIPHLILNQGNDQRLAALKMIEENVGIAKIIEQFPQFKTDEYLIAASVEKNPENFFEYCDGSGEWKLNENVIKSVCKNFRDFQKERFIDLLEIIEQVIEKKYPTVEAAISFRNELIIIQPQLALYIPKEKRNDFEIISRNGMAIEFLNLKKDSLEYIPLVKTAVNQNGLSIQFLGDEALKVPELVKNAIIQNPLAVQHSFPKSSTSRKYVANTTLAYLEIFKTANANSYAYLPERIRKREMLAKEAVSYNGRLLEFVPKLPRKQYEHCCKIALKQNCGALEFVSEHFQLQNKDLITDCLLKDPVQTLKYVHSEYLKDKKFVKTGIYQLRQQRHYQHLYESLQVVDHLVKRLRDVNSPLLVDEDILYEIFITSTKFANKDNIELLNEISEDHYFMERAMGDSDKWFEYACSHKKISPEQIKKFIQQGSHIGTLPEYMLQDQTWAKYLIEARVDYVHQFSFKLIRDLCTKDSEFENHLMKPIEKYEIDPWHVVECFNLIAFLSDSKRNNKEFALRYVKYSAINPKILSFLHTDLRNDPEIVFAACHSNPKAIEYSSRDLLSSINFVSKFLDSFTGYETTILELMSEELQMDKKIILKIIGSTIQPSTVLQLLQRNNKHNPLIHDPEIIEKCIQKNYNSGFFFF